VRRRPSVVVGIRDAAEVTDDDDDDDEHPDIARIDHHRASVDERVKSRERL
jgi:hypothetical protein